MKKILLISTLLVVAFAKSGRNVVSWCGRDRLSELNEVFLSKNFKFPPVESEARIWGGNPAVQGQFGFYTELQSFDGRFITPCGGALIRYNWVLTAGQCTVCARSVRLVFGQVDKNGGPISWLTDVNDPNHIHYHQNYNPWDFANNPFVNDIGLIYLQDSQEHLLIPHVTTVNYARSDDLFVGYQGYAMGYGGVTFPSTVLNYVNMPVITNEECNATFTGVITESNLCTSTVDGRSTCQGDAGGPLVINDQATGVWTLIGIGSFRHRDGCNLGHPAVFTRVTSFVEWIEETIGDPPQVPGPPAPPPAADGCQCYCNVCQNN